MSRSAEKVCLCVPVPTEMSVEGLPHRLRRKLRYKNAFLPEFALERARADLAVQLFKLVHGHPASERGRDDRSSGRAPNKVEVVAEQQSLITRPPSQYI